MGLRRQWEERHEVPGQTARRRVVGALALDLAVWGLGPPAIASSVPSGEVVSFCTSYFICSTRLMVCLGVF